MSLRYLKRFANITSLKSIDCEILLEFFKDFRPCLEAHGFDFTIHQDNTLDYAKLNSILANPPEDIDPRMVEALFIIYETGHFHEFDRLYQHAIHLNLELHDKITTLELAILLWKHDNKFLKEVHAELLLIQSKSFEYFYSKSVINKDFTVPNTQIIGKLKKSINEWFKNGKGGVYSITPIQDKNEQKVYFLIIHGKPMNKTVSIEDGKSKTIVYRPEGSQIIIYDYQYNIISMKRGTSKKERQMYLDNIGFYIFNDKNYFSSDQIYTLEPIFSLREKALSTLDIDGIRDVKLTEIIVLHQNGHKEIHRSQDIWQVRKARQTLCDISLSQYKLISVKFVMHFKHSERPRSITISLPNKAVFDRKEDSHIVEAWLRKRGFIFVKNSLNNTYEITNDLAVA